MIYLSWWKNIFNFTGRMTRKEYWIPTIINATVFTFCYFFIIPIALTPLSAFNVEWPLMVGFIIWGIIYIVYLIGVVSSVVRRLRDSGHKAIVVLLSFIPFGGFVVLVFLLQDSVEEREKAKVNYIREE